MENRVVNKPLLYNLIDGMRSIVFPSLIQQEEYAKTYFTESDYNRLKRDYNKSIKCIRKEVLSFDRR